MGRFTAPYFIVNARSALASPHRVSRVQAQISRRFPSAWCTSTTAPGDAIRKAQSAAREGADLVVAVGGDGTVNEVVNGLMTLDLAPDARPVLGIVPWGSGSDFVRTLGIPHHLQSALDILEQARVRTIDVGQVECARLEGASSGVSCRYFVNIAGCGPSARVVERFNRRTLRGRLGYVAAAGLTALDYRFPEVEIALDGRPADRVRLNVLFVCNGEYCGGGMHVGKGARLDDGLLQVVRVGGVSRLGSVLQWPRLYTGSVDRVRGASVNAAQAVFITSSEDVLVDCDGDVCGRLPATYRAVPGAIDACVP